MHSDSMVETEYGWALASRKPPKRIDINWLKLPERQVYFFDGDGWYRMDGQGFQPGRAAGDLPHG
jgi:hypothetical protein